MDATTQRNAARSGFTLVEMLTVIVIISILASLITAAAIAAIRKTREFTISSEMSQMTMSLEAYKTARGDYPPDFAGVSGVGVDATTRDNARLAVLRHLRKAFPKYRPGIAPGNTGANAWDKLVFDVNHFTGLNISQLDPSTALVFWLGGPPAGASSSTKLAGFSANPANPFATGGSRLPGLFEFDETRLDVSGSVPKYLPPHVQSPSGGDAPPYVYFRARSSGYIRDNATRDAAYKGKGDADKTDNPPIPSYTHTGSGTCVPYAESFKKISDTEYVFKWVNPKTFQIICSGLQGEYGQEVTTTPVPMRYIGEADNNLAPTEDDNLTNFTKGTLADGVQ